MMANMQGLYANSATVLLSNNGYEDVDKDKYKDKDEIESSETFSKLSTFTLRAPVEQ